MKVIAWILGLLLLAVVGFGVYIFMNTGSLLESGIETYAPQYLGADVDVGGVDLDLTTGEAKVSNLNIGNPAGYNGPYAMRLNTIDVALDAQNTSGELVVIKRMIIDGASIAAVAQGQNTNLQQLMENLEKAVGGNSGSSGSSSSAESTMRFIVDEFAFTNADVSLDSDILGQMGLNIPDIRLQDIGRQSNGATGAQLAQQILEPVTAAVTREAVNQGLDLEGIKANARQQVEDKLREELGGGLRGLTDRLKKD